MHSQKYSSVTVELLTTLNVSIFTDDIDYGDDNDYDDSGSHYHHYHYHPVNMVVIDSIWIVVSTIQSRYFPNMVLRYPE